MDGRGRGVDGNGRLQARARFHVNVNVDVGVASRRHRNCRTGTAGITLSTRCAAVSAILLPPHDGQKKRPPLQENASNRSLRHVSQCRRRKPHALMPHLK